MACNGIYRPLFPNITSDIPSPRLRLSLLGAISKLSLLQTLSYWSQLIIFLVRLLLLALGQHGLPLFLGLDLVVQILVDPI